jgi:hypothetical protein
VATIVSVGTLVDTTGIVVKDAERTADEGPGEDVAGEGTSGLAVMEVVMLEGLTVVYIVATSVSTTVEYTVWVITAGAWSCRRCICAPTGAGDEDNGATAEEGGTQDATVATLAELVLAKLEVRLPAAGVSADVVVIG